MLKKGLSLIEIVISLALFALVLASMANLFVVGKRYVILARSRTSGGELGRVFLDPLQLQVRQDKWGSNCLSSGASSGCPGTQTIDNVIYTPSYTINSVGGTNLERVTINISWPKTIP